MRPRKLTELTVVKARPPASGRSELWDTAVPGLCLRVTERGTKSWTVMYRTRGRQKRLTLGRYPTLGLVDARRHARTALAEVAAGRDPAAERHAEDQRCQQTLAATVDAFIERYAKPKNRDWRETQRLLRRELVAACGRRSISDITRSDIIASLDRMADRGASVSANRLLAHTRRFFNWCVERGLLAASPVSGLKPPGKETARDRVLKDDEVRALWQACRACGWPHGPIVQLLILTAQRLGEVATMRWQDLDLERALWALPAARTKAGRAHAVPLAPAAVTLLRQLPRFDDELVFPTRGGKARASSSFGSAKARLDQLSGVTEWRLHDLRRTVASGMARLGTAPHVVERILNHSSGTISGVAAVYNRYGYEAEMRHALDGWADTVLRLVSAEAVVPSS